MHETSKRHGGVLARDCRVRPVNLALPQVLLVWLAALLPLGLAIVRCRILQASRDVIFEGLLLNKTHTCAVVGMHI